MRGGGPLVVGIPGPELEPGTEAILRRVEPGGVILFRHNVVAADQLVALTGELEALLPGLLLFIDAEGGRVNRLSSVVAPAPAGSAMAERPPRFAERSGRWVGHALRLFDIDVDLAPVVDLYRGDWDNALADRYLGSGPGQVVSRGGAFLRGLQSAGVAGCLKHFPGLGAAREDTHHLPSAVELDRVELSVDLIPFLRLARRAESVMLSHATYPTLDPERRPASLSPPIVEGLLRREIGYRGLAVSDDLEMKALAPWGDLADRGELSLVAGCDALLVCNTLEAAPEIAARLGRRRHAERLAAAAERWEGLRRRLRSLRERSTQSYSLETVRKRLQSLA